jgi:hypothetical protein
MSEAVRVQQGDMQLPPSFNGKCPCSGYFSQPQRNYASQDAQFVAVCVKVGVAAEPRPDVGASFSLGRMRQG